MREIEPIDTSTRHIHPWPGPHREDVVRAVGGDWAEGILPLDIYLYAHGMLVAIDDHLQQGELISAIQDSHTLTMMAGRIYQHSYDRPEDERWLSQTSGEDQVCHMQWAADQGELLIERWLRERPHLLHDPARL